MTYTVHETSTVATTAFAKRYHRNLPPEILAEEPESAWNAPKEPACASRLRCHETQTESGSAKSTLVPHSINPTVHANRTFHGDAVHGELLTFANRDAAELEFSLGSHPLRAGSVERTLTT
jgi:hypothetical protein